MILRANVAGHCRSKATLVLVVSLGSFFAAVVRSARADDGSASATGTTTASHGLGVVALPGATDAAWPLAQAAYAELSLRPYGLDEATARILCGEPPQPGASGKLVDLAASVAALQGNDAPSRMLLAEIARRAAVRALLVVRIAGGRASARIFLPETGAFDAATFAPDEGAATTWSSAVKSLARLYGGQPPSAPVPFAEPSASQPSQGVPQLATHPAPSSGPAQGGSHPFYESAWFWGAVGAAVLAGGGVYLASRDTSPSTIHLELQVH